MTLPTDGMPEYGIQEGSGDSDEVLGSTTSLSGEINSVTFNSNSGGSEGNNEKGKGTSGGDKTISGCRITSSLRVRRSYALKKKMSSSVKIADALNRIADTNEIDAKCSNRMATEARVERMAAKARVYEISIVGILSHLNQVQEVVFDNKFYA